VAQFKQEFETTRKDVGATSGEVAMANYAESAMDLARPNADQSLYVHDQSAFPDPEWISWSFELGRHDHFGAYPAALAYK